LDGEVLLLLEESDKHKTLVTKGVEVIEDAPIYRIQRKMLIFLGQISSDLHYLLLPSEEEMSNRAVAWNPLHNLEFDIPFPDLLLPIRLDNLLPRIIELSLDATHRYCSLASVSKFQNEFMKTSFLPKYEPKFVRILPCSVTQYRAEILTIFCSYFGRNDDFKNSF
jgi:hypothetical protein